MSRGHIPYGYRIVDGEAIIVKEEADKVIEVCDSYLSGLSLAAAASKAGLSMSHTDVKHMMLNRRYLGDDFFPGVMDKSLMDRVVIELKARDDKATFVRSRSHSFAAPIAKTFELKKPEEELSDPFLQAQRIYESISIVEEK